MPHGTRHSAAPRQGPDFVAQFQHHALGSTFTDARYPGQRGHVTVGKRLTQCIAFIDRQGGQRDLGPYARDAQQHQEKITGVGIGESIERH